MHLTLAFFLITFKSPYTACLPGLDNASWLIRRSGERWKVRRSWIDMQVGKYGRWSSIAGNECCGERERNNTFFNIIRWDFCDIQNNQGQGRSYQLKLTWIPYKLMHCSYGQDGSILAKIFACLCVSGLKCSSGPWKKDYIILTVTLASEATWRLG